MEADLHMTAESGEADRIRLNDGKCFGVQRSSEQLGTDLLFTT